MERLLFKKSNELLQDFFKALAKEEASHIGLMGGWAVHYTLKSRGVVHLESRDIDIFFDPAKIKPSAIEGKLEKMGFHRHSTFRWAKYFDSDSEKELTMEQAKTHPIYETSTIYFDIATPIKIMHMMPEPLLKKVFGKEKQFISISGINVMVPNPITLIRMKLKSAPERNNEFKRTKDIADLYALLENHPELWALKEGQKEKPKNLEKKPAQKFREKLAVFKKDGTIVASAAMLKIDEKKLARLLEKI